MEECRLEESSNITKISIALAVLAVIAIVIVILSLRAMILWCRTNQKRKNFIGFIFILAILVVSLD